MICALQLGDRDQLWGRIPFFWKIGGKLAEIGGIHRNVAGKTADGVTSVENEQKIGEIPPKIAVLSCRVSR